nr:RNA-directed DNA polymerase, eukaryota, reverse transcriptase zinc-binding domain protein [Tanacetum cinerariifolium]
LFKGIRVDESLTLSHLFYVDDAVFIGTSLWSRFITALQGERVSFKYPGHISRPSPCNSIIRELGTLSSQCINLHTHLKKKVGNGVHTLFWDDTWITDIPLSQTYPRFMEEEQFLRLVDLVASVILSNSNNRWVWLLDSSGEYSVSSAHSYIDDMLSPTVEPAAKPEELELERAMHHSPPLGKDSSSSLVFPSLEL